MRKLLMVLTAIGVLSAVCYGGWEHVGGRTYWTEGATCSTCFLREYATGDIYPAPAPLVYFNTVKTTTNSVVSFGYFKLNTAGDYQPITTLTANSYVHRDDPGVIQDVEWQLNSNGDIQPKK